MTKRCVPMVHVPDVRATVEWYRSIGFDVVETYSEGQGLSFAVTAFGDTQVMFNSGGRPGTGRRRDVDLYLYTQDVDGIHARMASTLEVIEPPHDTFYGQRELTVRDPNGFHVTFGEPSAADVLMCGVRQGHADAVRSALARGVSPEWLNLALGAATGQDTRAPEIVDLLEAAGAVQPPPVGLDTLREYAGTYVTGDGQCVGIVLLGETLVAFPDDSAGVRLLPITVVKFTGPEDPGATVTFEREGDAVTGLVFSHPRGELRFRRTAPAG